MVKVQFPNILPRLEIVGTKRRIEALSSETICLRDTMLFALVLSNQVWSTLDLHAKFCDAGLYVAY